MGTGNLIVDAINELKEKLDKQQATLDKIAVNTTKVIP